MTNELKNAKIGIFKMEMEMYLESSQTYMMKLFVELVTS